GARPEDHRYIEWALAQANKRWRTADTSIFDFIHGVLTGQPADAKLHLPLGETLRVAMHFQQVAGPVMAKGCEDTAFYRYVRLLALNEVGGDPHRFGLSVEAFHAANADRSRRTPRTLLAAQTHDTKRSLDVRSRLVALAGVVHEWVAHVGEWRT